MKTKIIYISGAEIFDAADVRAAFEEVRGALNLPADVVMFGVPVDEVEESVQRNQESVVVESVKKPRAKTPKLESEETNQQSAISNHKSEKVIPILSVLAAKEEAPITTQVSIEDNIIEDVPENTDDTEKTLEELLEQMAPLRPDAPKHDTSVISAIDINELNDIAEDDETLNQLADEFISHQDEISAPVKTSGGKIGKLKNILPFKKQKGGDGGLMGDLFGWAGVAANDDEFTMPGFFAKA